MGRFHVRSHLVEVRVGLVMSAFYSVFHGPALPALADEIGQTFGESFFEQVDVDGVERLRQIILKEVSKVCLAV